MHQNAQTGADPKVVQWVLGHATAAMTIDLYGHMIDANLWQAARLVGDIYLHRRQHARPRNAPSARFARDSR